MKDITLRQIEYFLAVIDHGSLSAAATACRVSQTTVSSALAALEHQLDVTLVARGPARKAQPTTAGQAFALRARAIQSVVAEAVESVDEDAAALQGPLRLGCIPNAAPRMIPETLSVFSTDHPEVELSFIEDHPTTIQRMVLRGEIDLAVMYRRQIQVDGLDLHPLAKIQLHAVLPTDHRLAGRASVDIGELIDEPVILLDSPPTAEVTIGLIRGLGHEPRIRWRSPNAETIRSMVAWGLGFSLANAVPHPSNRSFQGMRVRFVELTNPELSNTMVGATLAGARPSKKLEALLGVLRRVAADTDPSAWS